MSVSAKVGSEGAPVVAYLFVRVVMFRPEVKVV